MVVSLVLVAACGSAPGATPIPNPSRLPGATVGGSATPVASATPGGSPAQAAFATPSASVAPATESDAVASRTWIGPLPDDPNEGGPGRTARVTDVAATAGGWVAVGWDAWGGVAWRSTDGVAWTPTDRPPTFDLVQLNAVAAAGGRVVAGGVDAQARAAAWWSDDGGATWSRAADTAAMTINGVEPALGPFKGGYYGITITSIAPLASGGFVAVGALQCSCMVGGFAAWTSADGTAWTRLGDPAKAEPGRGVAVTAFGAGWVANGEQGVRRSAGSAWTTTVPGGVPAIVAGPVASGHGLVLALRLTGEHDEPPMMVDRSTDAIAWTSLPFTVADGLVRDLAATPAGFVAVGTLGSGGPTRLWTSTDGTAWTATAVPLLDGEPTAVATSGGVTVVATNLGSGSESRAAIVRLPALSGAAPAASAPSRAPWVTPPAAVVTGLSLPTPVSRAAATLLADGRLLIAGGDRPGSASGHGSSTVMLLEPATGSASPGPPLPIPLQGATATTGPDGSVWLLGGGAWPGDGIDWKADAFVLDPSGRTWSAAPPGLRDLGWVSQAWTADGVLLLAIASGPRAALVAYHPATGGMPAERMSFGVDGMQVVVTGRTTWLVTGVRAWRRDAAGGPWEPGPLLPYRVDAAGSRAAALPDGRIAVLADDVLGPACNSTSVYSVVEVLDPASGEWATARLPQPRSGAALVALRDGRLAVVGGLRRTLVGCGWSVREDLADDVLLVVPPR